MTALTVNGSAVAATTLTAAGKLFAATGGTSGNTSTKVGSGTLYKQIFAKGTSTSQTGVASIPAPTDSNFSGWLWDVTTLEGQRIAAGTWTPTIHLLASTSTTVTPTVQWYKRSSAGIYTQIGSVAGSSIALTTSSQLLVFTAPSLALMDFAVGDKLCMWLWVNQTAGGATNSTISVVEATSGSSAGVASEAQAVTPGYAPIPLALASTLAGSGTFSSFPTIGSLLFVTGDNFARPDQSGWGQNSLGEQWALYSGPGAASIASDTGTITAPTGLTSMMCRQGNVIDGTILVRFVPSSASDGGGIAWGMDNASDLASTYALATNGALTVHTVTSGVDTLQYTATSPPTITGGLAYWMRVSPSSGIAQVRVWADGAAEPGTWQITTGASYRYGGIGYYGIVANIAAPGDTVQFRSFAVQAPARTYYVDEGAGSDSNDGLSPSTAFATLQTACDVMAAGAICRVAAGTYPQGTSYVLSHASGTPIAPVAYLSATLHGAVITGQGVDQIWYNVGSYVEFAGFELTNSGGPTSPIRLGYYNTGGWNKVHHNYIHDLPAIDTAHGGGGIDHGASDIGLNQTYNNEVARIGSHPLPAYLSLVQADTPIRFYRLGETSGTTAVDLGSQGHNGTISATGVTLNQAGVLVGDSTPSMLFTPASSGYIDLPTTGLPTGAAAWSMEAWVKMPATLPSGYATLLGFGAATGNEAAYLYYHSGQMDVGDNTSGILGGTIVAGGTYHVAATYDGVTHSLYVNGLLVNSGAKTYNITAGFARIGSDTFAGDYWSGIIGEVALYNVALSYTQVQNHFIAGSGGGGDSGYVGVHGIYHACPVGGSLNNNIIYQCGGKGINLDHYAYAVACYNNLVFNNYGGGIWVSSIPPAPVNDYTIVANNIVFNNYGGAGNGYYTGIYEDNGVTGIHNQYLNNCVFGNTPYADTGLQIYLRNGLVPVATVSADPLLVNYQPDGSGDYHLLAGSPCIDAGTSTGAPAIDYDGNARPFNSLYDIGPYEYTLFAASATLSGAGTISGTLSTTAVVSATMPGAGTLSGMPSLKTALTATLSGLSAVAGALSVSGTVALSAALAGMGTLSGTGTLATTLADTLPGVGSLAGTLTAALSLATTLAGASTLAALAPALSTALAGTCAGIGTLSGQPGAALTLPGVTFAGVGTCTGTASLSAALSGALAGIGTLSGALSGGGALAVTLAGVGTLTGALTLAMSLTGTLAGTDTLTAQLSANLALSGALAGVGALTGAMSEATALGGTSAGVGTLSGALSLSTALSATCAGSGTLTGTLAARLSLSETMAGGGMLAGTLSAATSLGGQCMSAGQLAGALMLQAPLGVACAGNGQLSGVLSLRTALFLTCAGAGVLLPMLVIAGGITGTLPGSGTCAGALSFPGPSATATWVTRDHRATWVTRDLETIWKE